MTKKIYLLLFSLLTLFTNAATFNSTGATTNWSLASTWTVVSGTDADGIPDTDDDIVILTGHSVSLSATSLAKTLTIANGATLTTNNQYIAMRGNFSNSGTVSGSLYFTWVNPSSSISSTSSLTIAILSLVNASTLNITSGTTLAFGSLQIRTGSTVNNSGNITVTTLTTVNSNGNTLNNLSGSTFTLGQNLANAMTITNNVNSTASLTKNVTSIPPTTGWGNLSLSGSVSSKAASSALTVNGNLTIASGVTLNLASNTLNLRGNLSNSGTVSSAATVNLNGTTNQTLSTTGTTVIPVLSVSNTNTIILSSGTFSNTTSNSFSSNLTLNAGATLNLNSVTLNLAKDLSNSGTISNAGTFNLNGSSNQTLTTTGTLTIPTLSVPNTNTIILNSGIFSNTTANSFNSNLTLNAGATLNLNSVTLNLTKDLSNSGTISNAGTFNLNGSSNQTLTTTGTLTIPTLTVPNTNTIILNSGTFSNTSSNSISSGLTINAAATLNLNSVTLNLAGSLSNSGTISNLADVNLNGTTAQTVSSSQSLAFDDLTCSNASGVSITSGNHSITNSLTVSSGNLNVGSNLVTLVSNITKTARIANSSGTISGSMIIQRYINARAAYYMNLSSPVTSTTINDWDNELYMSIGAPNDVPGYAGGDGSAGGQTYFVMTWNPVTDSNDYILTGATLVPGKGYTVFIGDNLTSFPGRSIDSRGTPNMGTQNPTLIFGVDGYNLVGNPHASYVQWSDIFAASSNIDATFQLLDNSGSYVDFTGSAEIPSGQGFWVYANNGAATLSIPQSAKTTTTNSNITRIASTKNYDLKVRLSSSMNPYYHEAKIVYDRKATSRFDKGIDIPFIKSPLYAAPSLVFIDGTSKTLRNHINTADETVIMPLQISTPIEGNYTIEMEGLFATEGYASAYILDNATGKQYAVNDGESVTLYFEKEQNDNFSLVLSKKK
ncbi:MAG TPA: hypothetical protein VGF30_14645, partial [Bacteroidia bacterium]